MSTRAKELLDEFTSAEFAIDEARKEVITSLQKKINQIQKERVMARDRVREAHKQYAIWLKKQE